MRILITGGFGFIGGRVAHHLQLSGHKVVLGSRSEHFALDHFPSAEVVQTIWADGEALERNCAGIDVIIHAAGMNAQDCATNPSAALEFNGVATARLVSAAIRAGVKRFLYLSTAHVYVNPLVGTITEHTCPRNLDPYAVSHLAGEHAVLSASQNGQIQASVLRLSNAFGVPVCKEVNCWMLLINDLCRQAVQTRSIVLNSSGLQQRDFISISEVCRITEIIASCNAKSVKPAIFNVGSGSSQSVLEIAQFVQQRCKKVLGFKPLIFRPEPNLNEKHKQLIFLPNRLNKMGIKVSINKADEIDQLLSFCKKSFALRT